MSQLKQILNDGLLYAISKLIPGLVGILFILIFTRILGLNNYGKYSLYIAQFNLLVSFAFGWLNQSELRYGNKVNNEDNKTKLFNLFLSLLILLVIIFLFHFKQNNFSNYVLITFFCTCSIGLYSYFKTIFQSTINPKAFLFLTLIQSILYISIPLITAVFYSLNDILLLICSGLSFLIPSFVLIFNNRSLFKLKIENYQILKKWFYFGAPVSIWASMGLMMTYLDRFFINKFYNSEIVGIYSSLNDFTVKLFSFLIFPFTMAIHPRITKLWNANKKDIAIDILSKSICSVIILFIIIVFAMILFNDLIINLIKFALPMVPSKNAQIYLPLAIAGILWQLSLIAHKMIELNEKTYIMLIFISFSLIINIIGNIHFLPRYGIFSTALASMLSALAYCCLCVFYFYKTRKKLKY